MIYFSKYREFYSFILFQVPSLRFVTRSFTKFTQSFTEFFWIGLCWESYTEAFHFVVRTLMTLILLMITDFLLKLIYDKVLRRNCPLESLFRLIGRTLGVLRCFVSSFKFQVHWNLDFWYWILILTTKDTKKARSSLRFLLFCFKFQVHC